VAIAEVRASIGERPRGCWATKPEGVRISVAQWYQNPPSLRAARRSGGRAPLEPVREALVDPRASEALLLGRVTYETFAEAWPSREGELADKLNSMPKYVVSSTLEQPAWSNSAVVKPDNLVEAVSKLKQEADADVVVHGSVQLARTLLEHDLVDELRLMMYPVILGTGKRLLSDTGEKKTLRLVDSKVVGDGVVILTYSPAAPA
jgi:dihydrofolate reductase